MKRTLVFAIVCFLISCQAALAQFSWTDLHPIPPQGLSYDGIHLYKMVHNAIVTNGGYGMMYSTDEGATWTNNTAIAPVGIRVGYTTFVTSTGRLITTRGSSSFKIIYSDDQGASWTETGSTLLDQLAWAAETNGTIYAKSFTTGAARTSTDNGLTWNQVPAGRSGQVGGADAGEIYVRISDSLTTLNSATLAILSKYALPETGGKIKTFGQRFFHTKNGKVYYSTDKQNWSELTSASVFLANAMEDVCVKGNDIYLVGAKGLYKTSDEGNTWTNPGGDSLPFIKVIATDNYIIGGYNFGNLGYTYRLGDDGTTSTEEAELGSIAVFPNPTKGVVQIQSSGKQPMKVVIYDRMGNIVNALEGPSPIHSVAIPDAAGLYVLRLLDERGQPMGSWKVIKE